MKVPRLIFSTCRILASDRKPDLQKQYEKLANLINDYGGRIHGSQFHGGFIIVYFELPKENLEPFLKEEKE